MGAIFQCSHELETTDFLYTTFICDRDTMTNKLTVTLPVFVQLAFLFSWLVIQLP